MIKLSLRAIKALTLTLLMIGCDEFPGPTLRNELNEQIMVKITYSDGSEHSGTWPPCMTVSVGRSEIGKFGIKDKAVGIERVVFILSNQKNIDMNKHDIEEIIKKQPVSGYFFWVIDKSGVHISTEKECPLHI